MNTIHLIAKYYHVTFFPQLQLIHFKKRNIFGKVHILLNCALKVQVPTTYTIIILLLKNCPSNRLYLFKIIYTTYMSIAGSTTFQVYGGR